MHNIEPHYGWLPLYAAEEDAQSPFFGNVTNDFEFSNAVYNYYIHPQWDNFGSATLYLKLLYADYTNRFCIIEFLGEWNDCLYNDIMYLIRNVVEVLQSNGINKYILIGENIMNFHASDDSYYQEWAEESEDGWIACLNFRPHVIREFTDNNLDFYLAFGAGLEGLLWRRLSPQRLFEYVSGLIARRLTA